MKPLTFILFICFGLWSSGQNVNLDPAFNSGTGPNNSVIATAIQPDGKILITGGFLLVDGQQRNSIARLNIDGSLDATFSTSEYFTQGFAIDLLNNGDIILGGGFQMFAGNIARISTNGGVISSAIGNGFDDNVWVTTVQSDQKILVGGYFNSYDGTSRNGIARLDGNLLLDASFDPGNGFDGSIRSITVQSDEKILTGGTFTVFDGVTRNCIARLNSNGTIDASFNPGTGFDSGVLDIKIQSDGKIIVVGGFNMFNGISRNRIARINADGTLDTSFNPGTGFDGTITTVNILSDGKILVGGDFTSFNGIVRSRIARLNSDGSLDTTFDPGAGFDALVWSINLQSDGKIIAGGNFTNFDGTAKSYLARLNVSTSELEEMSANSNAIHILPNPSEGHFCIELKNKPSEEFYTIFDNKGVAVNTGVLTELSTNLELDLKSGYFYFVVGDNAIKFEVVK